MDIEAELTSLIAQLTRLRQSARHARDDELAEAVVQISRHTRSLETRFDQISEFVARSAESQRVDFERQILNVMGSHNHQMALLTSLSQKFDALAVGRTDDSAVFALIAAHDQLTHLVAISGIEHVDIVQGQRSNIELALTQLGILPIEVESGSAFSTATMESDSRTVSVADSTLNGRVAAVLRTGWQQADGARCVRLARVQVFAFVASVAAESDCRAIGSAEATSPAVSDLVESIAQPGFSDLRANEQASGDEPHG